MRNLLPHFIILQARAGNTHGVFDACALFVDVTGFTPMTESLMEHGSEGAEILSGILNTVFEPMVDAVYLNGGFVSNFPGDAFTAIFQGPDAHLGAARLAGRIGAIFSRQGRQQTKFGLFDLAVRTSLAAGEVEWGIVGSGPSAYYFRGGPLDRCAAGKRLAQPGDAMLDTTIAAMLAAEGVVTEPATEGFYLLASEHAVVGKTQRPDKRPTLDKSMASRFLPSEVLELTGPGEFRDVASVFLSFQGIDDHASMETFASAVLTHATSLSGYVKEIELVEGNVIPVFFGAPVGFENNIERALHFVVALHRTFHQEAGLAGLELRAGISHGRVFAGIVGGAQRSQYTVIGAMVNLAARLASSAPWGAAFATERVARQRGFSFEDVGRLPFKGLAATVRTFALTGEHAAAEGFFSDSMVGRSAELRMLLGFAAPIFQPIAGDATDGAFAGIAYIYGDPGIGKSQLAYSLRRTLEQDHDLSWFTAPSDPILDKPFSPFISFLTRYLGQSCEATEQENRARLELAIDSLIARLPLACTHAGADRVEDVLRELNRTRSILGALVGVRWDGSLYEQLDAKGRYENTLFALKNLFLSESLLRPVVIHFEEGHRLDIDSAAAIAVITRNIASSPMLLLVTSRYDDDGGMPRIDLEDLPEINLRLNNLSEHEHAVLASGELGGSLSEPLRKLLLEKTRGNPFFLQQMLLYFKEEDLLEERDMQWQLKPDEAMTVALPESIRAMLIGRIDRLASRVKEVVKAAAVVGTEFELPLLSSVLKNDVSGEVRQAERRRIWGTVEEIRYIFKHALLRDAAYDMQLRARLRELHRAVGLAMESLYAASLPENAAEIAYHFEKAEAIDTSMFYLEMAADHARGSYQNRRAIELYERLLARSGDRALQTVSTIAISMKLAKVLEVSGDWNRAADLFLEAGEVAERTGESGIIVDVRRELSWIYNHQGKYQEALGELSEALRGAEELNDLRRISSVLGDLGVVYYDMGEFDLALEHYQRQRTICEELDDREGIAGATSNAGLIFRARGEYVRALDSHRQWMEISRSIGDRRGESIAVGNMGRVYFASHDLERALDCYRAQRSICEELGDRLGISIAIGNIGTVHYRRGEYDRALECYRQELDICRELGNLRGAGMAIGNMGSVYYERGEYDRALESYREDLKICEKLADRNGMFTSIGNIASVLYELGQYEPALAEFAKAAAGHRSTGCRAELSCWLEGEALVLLDLLESGRELPEFLCRFLAGSVAEQGRPEALRETRVCVEEFVDIARELNLPDMRCVGEILLARVEAAEGDPESAVQRLWQALSGEPDDHNRAELLYRLWKLGHDGSGTIQSSPRVVELNGVETEANRAESLRLFQALATANPKHKFAVRIAELAVTS